MDSIDELLTRGVQNIIPGYDELKKTLESGKKLNVYLGIDPTATHIHLGHGVVLRKLQQFAELGHNVTFLIGDFTALIGDTSDKESERPVLTNEEIEANFQTYKSQAEKIVDFSKVTIRRNSEWLKKLTFEDIIKLVRNFSVGDFISRELIRKRLDEGKRVRFDETMYPVMQGYDSYFMDTDLQLGGADQTFNMQAGRTLQRNLRDKESFVLSTEYLMGTDGRKMSKSWGNAVWLDDSPEEMYTKIMAINDDVIVEYFALATNVTLEKVNEVKNRLENNENPRDIKKELAFELVKELNGEEAASIGQDYFERRVQKGELSEDIPTVTTVFDTPLVTVLLDNGFIESKSELKRLIEQNGVRVNTEVVSDVDQPIHDNDLIEIGKRRAVRVSTT